MHPPDEQNIPPCPTHGAPPRALHTHNFAGIIEVCEEILDTISGVGTTSFSRCPYGYDASFAGVVRVLEDLNTTISGIQGGGGGGGSASGVVGGSGIYVTISGDSFIINSAALPVYPGSGITPEASGTGLNTGTVFHVVNRGTGTVQTSYDGTVNVINGTGGSAVIISGQPGSGYGAGTLWFDTNQGRLFVYASGDGVIEPDFYQTNAEALAYMSETPPSGVGDNAPPRDGFLWFNKDLGNMLVYDAQSSGWYETGPRRDLAFRDTAPTAAVAGEAFFDSSLNSIKVWNGSEWISSAASALPSVSTTTISGTVLNSYPASSPGTRTYTVNVERGGEIQTSDIKFINTASDAYTSVFAVVYSSGLLASFSGEVSGGQVNLLAYSNTTDYTTFRSVLTTP